MSYEVLIQVHPPETLGDDWPPPEAAFRAWADGLREFVEAFGNSRQVDVYGPAYRDFYTGQPTPTAVVNIWTEEYTGTWATAVRYALLRVTKLEAAGYDVRGVDITPTRHLMLMG
jgi:hypothetical protein